MSDYKFDAAEVHKQRESLMGIEILLNQLYRESIYQMDSGSTEVVVQALATGSKARLYKALAWLEEIAEKGAAA